MNPEPTKLDEMIASLPAETPQARGPRPTPKRPTQRKKERTAAKNARKRNRR